MSNIKEKVLNILQKKENCNIATTDNQHVDNALVAFYAEGLTIYFGSFTDTLKGRFIEKNSQVAMKFPFYKSFFEYENNELYKVQPLIIWHYDHHKGMMYRDKIIVDENYYKILQPYEPPAKFKHRS